MSATVIEHELALALVLMGAHRFAYERAGVERETASLCTPRDTAESLEQVGKDDVKTSKGGQYANMLELGPSQAELAGYNSLGAYIHPPVDMSSLPRQLASPPGLRFNVLQPTPSSVRFTVSTRPVPKTLVGVVWRYVSIALRALVGLCTAVLLWTKWRITVEKPTTVLQWAVGRAREAALLELVAAWPWLYVAPAALIAFLPVFRKGYTGRLNSTPRCLPLHR